MFKLHKVVHSFSFIYIPQSVLADSVLFFADRLTSIYQSKLCYETQVLGVYPKPIQKRSISAFKHVHLWHWFIQEQRLYVHVWGQILASNLGEMNGWQTNICLV